MGFGDGKILEGLLGSRGLRGLTPEEHNRLELALAVKLSQSQVARLPQALREELGAGLVRMYSDQARGLPAGSVYLLELVHDGDLEGKAGELRFVRYDQELSEDGLRRESDRLHGSSLWLIRKS